MGKHDLRDLLRKTTSGLHPEIEEGYAERERNVVLLLEAANCLNHDRMIFHFVLDLNASC